MPAYNAGVCSPTYGADAPRADLGIVITNRNRPAPLALCLRSLAMQSVLPAWVVLADLGSEASSAAELEAMADRFGISYLRIAYFGTWNQALAFNTALRHMPAVGHAVQLDADFILHPFLLAFTQRALGVVEAFCCVPSYVGVEEIPAAYDGSAAAFGELLRKAYAGNKLSRGGYVAMPRDWLLRQRSFDEAYEGWGFEDADLWWRAERRLSTYQEISGSLAIHQSHMRQTGSADGSNNPNWVRYQRRLSGAEISVNPRGFGEAPVADGVIRQSMRAAQRQSGMASDGDVPGGHPRVRQGEKIRPARREEQVAPHELSAADLLGLAASRGNRTLSRPRVCVVLEESQAHHVVAAALATLQSQTLPAGEVCFLGPAAIAQHWIVVYGRQFERCVHLAGDAMITDREAADVALANGDDAFAFTLFVRGDWILHPRMLELLVTCGEREGCSLSGPVHVAPPAAAELSLLDGIPWEAWASVAHAERQSMGRWRLFARESTDGGVHASMRAEEASTKGSDELTQQDLHERGLRVSNGRHLASDFVLCFCCPRKIDLPEIYG